MSATATAVAGNDHVAVESRKQFDRALLEDAPEVIEVSALGEGLKLVSRRTSELDREFATWLLELTPFNSDRPLNDRHVMMLKTAMERGTFLPEQVQIITCTLDGTEYRMNGQHTSWARIYAPEKYRCPIQHLRYKAETEHDMRRLYASIDRMKSRTSGNVIVSYLFETEDWKGCSKRTLVKLAEGMGYWLWESQNDRTRHDADHRAVLLMTDQHTLGRKVAEFLQECNGIGSRHIIRGPVIGGMFATFHRAAASAREFWSPVRDGTGFGSKDDPRLKLRNSLMSASIAHGNGATAEKKSVGGEEMYRWCIYAWNSWRRGEQLKLLKSMLGSDRPKAL